MVCGLAPECKGDKIGLMEGIPEGLTPFPALAEFGDPPADWGYAYDESTERKPWGCKKGSLGTA